MISIRDYRSDDFDELLRIDQSCFAPGIAYSRRELSWYMRRSQAFTLIAEEDEIILGFIVAESDRVGAGHILTIDVRPSAQRTRVGSKLLHAAEEHLSLQECTAVLLETAVNNAPALAFYKRHGYSVLETLPRYYLDSIDALVMGKHLPPARAQAPMQVESSKAKNRSRPSSPTEL